MKQSTFGAVCSTCAHSNVVGCLLVGGIPLLCLYTDVRPNRLDVRDASVISFSGTATHFSPNSTRSP